jgi:hypothetical protein
MKDVRYGKIKLLILVALVAFLLISFNLIKPVFESRAAEARTDRIAAERAAEDIEEIKSDTAAFKKKFGEAEAEIMAYEERVGLSPDAAQAYLAEKAAGAGISGGDVSISEGGETPYTRSLIERGYTVIMRADYDKGVSFMRELEGDDASWSVTDIIYDDSGGGEWVIELSLRAKKEAL